MDFLRSVALVLSAAAALGAGLSLGGFFSRRMDIATHALPVWLLCALMAAGLTVLLGVTGAPVSSSLSLFAIMVGAALSAPEMFARRADSPPAGQAQTLKIIQFNVWSSNRDPVATVQWIIEQDADIVMLQEAEHRAAPVIDGLKDHYPYRMPEIGVAPKSDVHPIEGCAARRRSDFSLRP